jgi:hypothetical protein
VRDLINRIPTDIFWALVAGWFLGGATVWRFARYLERFRDALRHARHHWERSMDFYRFATSNIAGMIAASVVVLCVLGFIGTLAYVRATG